MSLHGFAQLLTVDQTFIKPGVPLIPPEVIEQERREMDHAEFMQEYYCSWQGLQQGAIYPAELEDLKQNRFGHYPADPDDTAIAAWDIGHRDATAILILQKHPTNNQPVLVDYIEDRNAGLPHYVKLLQQVPLHIRYHFWPHDGFKHEWGTGASVVPSPSSTSRTATICHSNDKARAQRPMRESRSSSRAMSSSLCSGLSSGA